MSTSLSRLVHRSLSVAMLVVISACKDGGTSETSVDGTTADTSASTSNAGSTSTGGSSTAEGVSTSEGSVSTDAGGDIDTTGVPGQCEGHSAFTCAGIACTPETCGPLEQFDEQGCLRPFCEAVSDCGAGMACYRPVHHARCDFSWTEECAESNGECVCVYLEGLAAWGFCVDESDVPSPPTAECAIPCETLGSHSVVIDTNCFCENGYDWCFPRAADDFTCCPP